MPMLSFPVAEQAREGYLALPPSGRGQGLLFLHAWWGLTDFFQQTCDSLAEQGFVVLAPDLHHGRTATTIAEATELVEGQDFPAVMATAEGAMRFLQSHTAVEGDQLYAMGFSMGAAFAYMLDEKYPEAFAKIVYFYGASEGDLAQSKAHLQAHFADNDEWEPLENVLALAAPNLEKHIYPNTQHWFLEANQPGYYDAEAAELAWQRTIAFLGWARK